MGFGERKQRLSKHSKPRNGRNSRNGRNRRNGQAAIPMQGERTRTTRDAGRTHAQQEQRDRQRAQQAGRRGWGRDTPHTKSVRRRRHTEARATTALRRSSVGWLGDALDHTSWRREVLHSHHVPMVGGGTVPEVRESTRCA
eukprot:4732779-Prymnesium_polylepis.1